MGISIYSKTCLKRPLKKKTNSVFKTDCHLMQVKVLQNAPKEHSAILSTFIKLPFVFKTIVLSVFEWALKTGFTVFKLEHELGWSLTYGMVCSNFDFKHVQHKPKYSKTCLKVATQKVKKNGFQD